MMVDESMHDEPIYNEWITGRRTAEPSRDLTDRVMAAVANRAEEQGGPNMHLAGRVNGSRPARWAACLAALLIGILPFLYVAYVAYVANSLVL